MRAIATATTFAVLVIGLSACGEPPQRLETAAKPGYQTDAWNEQLRSRTLRQNESNRIGQ